MVEANFAKLQKDLQTVAKDAWKADTGDTFVTTLRAIFGKETKAKYIECVTSDNFAECLRAAAAERGVGEKMAIAWNTAPRELKKKLSEIGAKWGDAERAAVKRIVRGADIPRLFKLCATGKIDEVATELGIDRPAHYKDCVRAVVESKGLAASLSNLWPVEEA